MIVKISLSWKVGMQAQGIRPLDMPGAKWPRAKCWQTLASNLFNTGRTIMKKVHVKKETPIGRNQSHLKD